MEYSTVRKIVALYRDRDDIDHVNSKGAFSQTISILKSGGLRSAWIYTGTRPKPTSVDGLLVLRPNIKARIYAIIYVNYVDEYVIDFISIKADNAALYDTSGGVYLDELAGAYESMYDAYIQAEQNGFIRI